MIEALGQMAVFFLIKGITLAISEKVDPSTIFFTSCDGVKCRRICKRDLLDEGKGFQDSTPIGLLSRGN